MGSGGSPHGWELDGSPEYYRGRQDAIAEIEAWLRSISRHESYIAICDIDRLLERMKASKHVP